MYLTVLQNQWNLFIYIKLTAYLQPKEAKVLTYFALQLALFFKAAL